MGHHNNKHTIAMPVPSVSVLLDIREALGMSRELTAFNNLSEDLLEVLAYIRSNTTKTSSTDVDPETSSGRQGDKEIIDQYDIRLTQVRNALSVAGVPDVDLSNDRPGRAMQEPERAQLLVKWYLAMQVDLGAYKDRNNSQAKTIEAQIEYLSKLKNELQNKDIELERLKNLTQELNNTKDSLLKDLQIKYEKYSDEVADLHAEIQRLKAEPEYALDDLQKKYEQAMLDLQGTAQDLLAAENKYKSLEKDYKLQSSLIDELQGLLRESTNALVKMTTAAKGLEKQNGKLRAHLKRQIGSGQALSQELANLHEAVLDLAQS